MAERRCKITEGPLHYLQHKLLICLFCLFHPKQTIKRLIAIIFNTIKDCLYLKINRDRQGTFFCAISNLLYEVYLYAVLKAQIAVPDIISEICFIFFWRLQSLECSFKGAPNVDARRKSLKCPKINLFLLLHKFTCNQ